MISERDRAIERLREKCEELVKQFQSTQNEQLLVGIYIYTGINCFFVSCLVFYVYIIFYLSVYIYLILLIECILVIYNIFD